MRLLFGAKASGVSVPTVLVSPEDFCFHSYEWDECCKNNNTHAANSIGDSSASAGARTHHVTFAPGVGKCQRWFQGQR